MDEADLEAGKGISSNSAWLRGLLGEAGTMGTSVRPRLISGSSMTKVCGSASESEAVPLLLYECMISRFFDLKLEFRLIGIRELPELLVDFTVLCECADL